VIIQHQPLIKFFRHTDYPLLRKQKLVLLEAQKNLEGTKEGDLAEECMSGIIHLIDALQDTAVASGLKTELEVFGELRE